MMKIIIALLSFVISSAYAAQLEDVTVLDLISGKDSFKVKLQLKDKKDSYFLVDIVQKDEKSLYKLGLVLKKIKKKDEFKLNLNIPSFSAYPAGSYYRSESVTFSGTSEGESLINP